jgi:hypothetical protein
MYIPPTGKRQYPKKVSESNILDNTKIEDRSLNNIKYHNRSNIVFTDYYKDTNESFKLKKKVMDDFVPKMKDETPFRRKLNDFVGHANRSFGANEDERLNKNRSSSVGEFSRQTLT